VSAVIQNWQDWGQLRSHDECGAATRLAATLDICIVELDHMVFPGMQVLYCDCGSWKLCNEPCCTAIAVLQL
jgi:hypothetical protein